MGTVKKVLRGPDSFLVQHLGPKYIKYTRDPLIDERCRFVVDTLRTIGTSKTKSILDVGCGGGFLLPYLEHSPDLQVARYHGIDMQGDQLADRFREIRLSHSFTRVDLRDNWDFGTYDLVVCLEVIEHLADDEALFRKLCRHLNSGGTLILSTPNINFIRLIANSIPNFDAVSPTEDGGHVRAGYSKQELAYYAERFGLNRPEFHYISRLNVKQVREMQKYRGHPKSLFYNMFLGKGRPHPPYVAEKTAGDDATWYWSLAAVCQKMA